MDTEIHEKKYKYWVRDPFSLASDNINFIIIMTYLILFTSFFVVSIHMCVIF
ncbi:hypothetical protein MtrunA17_Chr8g0353681 [Medicago truncatula]|uniref:Transmembrane protein n=1 Tax=Medicago truncatula TaxID=3880 RepID=A0A396GNT3_MEDTR|nr:hypothetical protein MtrunA17_Chr8g0353681 [Medicago truncatula]